MANWVRSLLRIARLIALTVLIRTLARLQTRRATRRHRQNRAVVIGAYGNGNYGDDIIGIEVARQLARFGYRVTVLGRGPDFSRLSPHTRALMVGNGLSGIIRSMWWARGADVAILGGGGLLEGRGKNVHAQRLILEYLAKLLAAGVMGARTFVYAVGVNESPLDEGRVDAAIAVGLRAVQQVSVRDRASLHRCDQMGVAAWLVRDPGVSVLHELVQDREPARAVGVVVLDRYGWPAFSDPDSRGDTQSARRRDLIHLADTIEVHAAPGAEIRLIPFHWSDPPLLNALALILKARGHPEDHIRLVPYPKGNAHEPFQLLMECRTVISMRFHPSLAAIAANRDLIVFGDLQKLKELEPMRGARLHAMFPSDFAPPDDVLASWLAEDTA